MWFRIRKFLGQALAVVSGMFFMVVLVLLFLVLAFAEGIGACSRTLERWAIRVLKMVKGAFEKGLNLLQ